MHGAAQGGLSGIEAMAALLDSLGIALCLFDDGDCTVLWNATFLVFFPEHKGHVHAGEHYSHNLRRFYEARLTEAERPHIDRFIADGIARHRAQSRPFSFQHRGRSLLVAATAVPSGDGPPNRLRIWMDQANSGTPDPARQTTAPESSMFQLIADGAMVLGRDGRITAANQEFAALYDMVDPADAIGLTLVEIVQRAWQTLGDGSALPPAIVAMIDSARFAGAVFEVELPGDRWRRVLERRADDGTGYISHADITELKRQQRDLRHANARLEALSGTDSLTGIANRRRFESVLQAEVRRAAQAGEPLALLLVDLDGLKALNDGFGHAAGDAGLVAVAAALQESLRRPRDLVARLGGDEFACLLPHMDLEQGRRIGERLCAAVRATEGTCVPLTVSIGVACLMPSAGQPGPLPDASALMDAADRALYVAKRSGRDQVGIAPE